MESKIDTLVAPGHVHEISTPLLDLASRLSREAAFRRLWSLIVPTLKTLDAWESQDSFLEGFEELQASLASLITQKRIQSTFRGVTIIEKCFRDFVILGHDKRERSARETFVTLLRPYRYSRSPCNLVDSDGHGEALADMKHTLTCCMKDLHGLSSISLVLEFRFGHTGNPEGMKASVNGETLFLAKHSFVYKDNTRVRKTNRSFFVDRLVVFEGRLGAGKDQILCDFFRFMSRHFPRRVPRDFRQYDDCCEEMWDDDIQDCSETESMRSHNDESTSSSEHGDM